MASRGMAKNIVQITPRYYPYLGGMETHVRKISEGLTEQGYSVEVLTTDPSGKLPREGVENGITVRRFSRWPVITDYFFSPGLWRYLFKNRSRYQIMHCHNYGALPALQAASITGGCRFVFTPHYHPQSSRSIINLLRIPYGWAWSLLMKRIDRIICVSNAEKESFQRKFSLPDESLRVIPNGIEGQSIVEAQPYEIHEDVILYVGRLAKYKNVHLIIEAMQHLDKKYILRIAGDGPYKSHLVQQVQTLGLGERVQFLSGLKNEEIYRWYKTCSVFVTLSELEAFGITLMEAVAAKKPVVASDIPAFQEIADNFEGIQLVNIHGITSSQLAVAIDQAAQSGCLENDISKYNWSNIAREVAQIYEEISQGK